MKSFKDTKGNTWDIDLTLGKVRRIKSRFDIDILALDEKALKCIISDQSKLGEIIALMIEDQFDAKGFEAEDVYDSFNADVMHDCTKGFIAELGDFFLRTQQPAKKALMEKILEQTKHALDQMALEISEMELQQLGT